MTSFALPRFFAVAAAACVAYTAVQLAEGQAAFGAFVACMGAILAWMAVDLWRLAVRHREMERQLARAAIREEAWALSRPLMVLSVSEPVLTLVGDGAT